MVIFDCKHLQAVMATGEIPGTFYGLSDSRWMDSELFINGLSTMHFRGPSCGSELTYETIFTSVGGP